MGFLIRVLVNALAIWLATEIVPGIEAKSLTIVLVAAIVLGLVNAIVRPVLLILTLPLTLVTLGLFLFVLNALCLWLTSAVVPGFDVRGFWAAFWGALLVSALSWVVNGFVSDRGRVVVITEREQPPRDWRVEPALARLRPEPERRLAEGLVREVERAPVDRD
jgi:putative membrane protein